MGLVYVGLPHLEPTGPSKLKLSFIHFLWGTAYNHNEPALGLTQSTAFPLTKAAFSIPENTCLPPCLIPLGSRRWSVSLVRSLSRLQRLQSHKQQGQVGPRPQLLSAAPADAAPHPFVWNGKMLEGWEEVSNCGKSHWHHPAGARWSLPMHAGQGASTPASSSRTVEHKVAFQI